MSANANPSTWREHVKAVHEEAAGLVDIQVIRREDMSELIGAGFAGDAEARQLLRMVNDALRGIQDAPQKRPMLCGSCPRPLRNGRYAIVIARPARDDPRQGLALAICEKCGTTHDAINAKTAVALARIWPDVRAIKVTHPEGGRA